MVRGGGTRGGGGGSGRTPPGQAGQKGVQSERDTYGNSRNSRRKSSVMSEQGSVAGSVAGDGPDITDADVEKMADRMSLLLTSAYGQDKTDKITEGLMSNMDSRDVGKVLTSMKATESEDVHLVMFHDGDGYGGGGGMTTDDDSDRGHYY